MPPIQVVLTLDVPTDSQLLQMVDLTVAGFSEVTVTNAMTGGIQKRKVDLCRLFLRAAALEGKIFVCLNGGTEEIVSVGACFGPGTDFLGSDAQQALGADDFFSKLPKETIKWYKRWYNIPMSKTFVEETIGGQTATDNWWIDSLVTLESTRKKSYGSAILNAICKKAAEDCKIVAFNATTEYNVSFHKANGFEVIGCADRPLPFGTWTNYMMVWKGNN